MTDHDELTSIERIEKCRKINRLAATKYAEQGTSLEDIAIAALYSALDLASTLTQDPIAGVEWLRTGIDLQERSIMRAKGAWQ